MIRNPKDFVEYVGDNASEDEILTYHIAYTDYMKHLELLEKDIFQLAYMNMKAYERKTK